MQVQDGGTQGKSLFARMWFGMDDHFLKPLLTHSNPTLMETMPKCCLGLTRFLTSTEQLSKHPAMMGRTLTWIDLDHVEGDVVVAPSPSSAQITQDEDFRFPRRSSDNTDLNGGDLNFEADTTDFEFLHGDGGGADKMPSHI